MKKRIGKYFNLVLILAIVFALCPVRTVRATDLTDFTMEGSVVTGYTGSGGNITIPSTATAIADNAFAGNSSISAVSIPANVTSVGTYAFSGCTGLGSVTFGGSVSLGGGVFYGCCSHTG